MACETKVNEIKDATRFKTMTSYKKCNKTPNLQWNMYKLSDVSSVSSFLPLIKNDLGIIKLKWFEEENQYTYIGNDIHVEPEIVSDLHVRKCKLQLSTGDSEFFPEKHLKNANDFIENSVEYTVQSVAVEDPLDEINCGDNKMPILSCNKPSFHCSETVKDVRSDIKNSNIEISSWNCEKTLDSPNFESLIYCSALQGSFQVSCTKSIFDSNQLHISTNSYCGNIQSSPSLVWSPISQSEGSPFMIFPAFQTPCYEKLSSTPKLRHSLGAEMSNSDMCWKSSMETPVTVKVAKCFPGRLSLTENVSTIAETRQHCLPRTLFPHLEPEESISFPQKLIDNEIKCSTDLVNNKLKENAKERNFLETKMNFKIRAVSEDCSHLRNRSLLSDVLNETFSGKNLESQTCNGSKNQINEMNKEEYGDCNKGKVFVMKINQSNYEECTLVPDLDKSLLGNDLQRKLKCEILNNSLNVRRTNSFTLTNIVTVKPNISNTLEFLFKSPKSMKNDSYISSENSLQALVKQKPSVCKFDKSVSDENKFFSVGEVMQTSSLEDNIVDRIKSSSEIRNQQNTSLTDYFHNNISSVTLDNESGRSELFNSLQNQIDSCIIHSEVSDICASVDGLISESVLYSQIINGESTKKDIRKPCNEYTKTEDKQICVSDNFLDNHEQNNLTVLVKKQVCNKENSLKFIGKKHIELQCVTSEEISKSYEKETISVISEAQHENKDVQSIQISEANIKDISRNKQLLHLFASQDDLTATKSILVDHHSENSKKYFQPECIAKTSQSSSFILKAEGNAIKLLENSIQNGEKPLSKENTNAYNTEQQLMVINNRIQNFNHEQIQTVESKKCYTGIKSTSEDDKTFEETFSYTKKNLQHGNDNKEILQQQCIGNSMSCSKIAAIGNRVQSLKNNIYVVKDNIFHDYISSKHDKKYASEVLDGKDPFLGFRTAAGNVVKITEQSLKKAKKLFHDQLEFSDERRTGKYFGEQFKVNENIEILENDLHSPGTLNNKMSDREYTTVLQDIIKTPEDALEKDKRTLRDSNDSTNESFPQHSSLEPEAVLQNTVGCSEEIVETIKNEFFDNVVNIQNNIEYKSVAPSVKESCFGFRTVDGNAVEISSDFLAKAKVLFNGDTELCNGRIKENYKEQQCRIVNDKAIDSDHYQSHNALSNEVASKKVSENLIKISEEVSKMDNCLDVLEEDKISNNKMFKPLYKGCKTLTTMQNAEVKNSEKTSKVIKNWFLGNDVNSKKFILHESELPPNNDSFFGFRTAAGNAVKISEHSLKKAKIMFHEENGLSDEESVEHNTVPNLNANTMCREVQNTLFLNVPDIELCNRFKTASENRISKDSSEKDRITLQEDGCEIFQRDCGAVDKEIYFSEVAEILQSRDPVKNKIFDSNISCELHKNYKPKVSNDRESLFGFKTAAGNAVKISEKSVAKAKMLFNEEFGFCSEIFLGHNDQFNATTCHDIQNGNVLQAPDSKLCNAFKTASGNAIKISKQALEKAKATIRDDSYSGVFQQEHRAVGKEVPYFEAESTLGNRIKATEKSSDSVKDNTFDIYANNKHYSDYYSKVLNGKDFLPSFRTAAGNAVNISEQSLKKAKKLFHDDGRSGEIENHTGQQFSLLGDNKTVDSDYHQTLQTLSFNKSDVGFKTAAGNYIKVSEEALKKAKIVFQENSNDVSESIPRSKNLNNIEIIANIENCKDIINSSKTDIINNSDTNSQTLQYELGVLVHKVPCYGFCTSAGNAMMIPEKCVEKTKTLLHEDIECDNERIIRHNTKEQLRNTADHNDSEFTQNHEKQDMNDNGTDELKAVSGKSSENSKIISAMVKKELQDSDSIFQCTADDILGKHMFMDNEMAYLQLENRNPHCNESKTHSVVNSKNDALVICQQVILSQTINVLLGTTGSTSIQLSANNLNQSENELIKLHNVECIKNSYVLSNKTCKRKCEVLSTPPKNVNHTAFLPMNLETANMEAVEQSCSLDKGMHVFKKQKTSDDKSTLQFSASTDNKNYNFATSNSSLINKTKKFKRKEQSLRISNKMKLGAEIKPGKLWMLKNAESTVRLSIKEAVGSLKPDMHSVEELYSAGVKDSTLHVTSANAGNFVFDGKEYFNFQNNHQLFAVKIGDDALLIFDDNGSAGKEELYRAFQDSPGVDSQLIKDQWFYNHYRWIIWKLASMEISFPSLFGGRCLSPDEVLFQLKWRYDCEIDNGKRSALRKIMERDDTPSKTLILCISGITDAETESINKSVRNEDSNIKTTDIVLKVTDGWYEITAHIDAAMCRLIKQGKLKIGQKIITSAAELVGSDVACNPLEVPADLMLKINTNSTRRAQWDCKLGYYSNPRPFPVSLSSLFSDGGLVGCVKVIVVRVYPLLFMEKYPDRSSILRNEKVELQTAELHDKVKQLHFEKLAVRVEKSLENKGISINRKRKHNMVLSVSELSSGKEIYERMECEDDPLSFQKSLSSHQLLLLEAFKNEQQEQCMSHFKDEVQRAISEEQEKGKFPCDRIVIPLLKILVKGALKSDRINEKGVMLTVWRPSENILQLLTEGKTLRIYYLAASKGRRQELQLNSIKTTKYEEISVDLETYNKIYEPRKIVSLDYVNHSLGTVQEIDVVGLIFHITPVSSIPGSESCQMVYLTDADFNTIVVKFWNGLNTLGLLELLQVGKIVAASNLKVEPVRGNLLPSVVATVLSVFSCNPKSRYLQESFQDMKNKIKNVSECIEKSKEILQTRLEKSKHNVRYNDEDTPIKNQMYFTSGKYNSPASIVGTFKKRIISTRQSYPTYSPIIRPKTFKLAEQVNNFVDSPQCRSNLDLSAGCAEPRTHLIGKDRISLLEKYGSVSPLPVLTIESTLSARKSFKSPCIKKLPNMDPDTKQILQPHINEGRHQDVKLPFVKLEEEEFDSPPMDLE